MTNDSTNDNDVPSSTHNDYKEKLKVKQKLNITYSKSHKKELSKALKDNIARRRMAKLNDKE